MEGKENTAGRVIRIMCVGVEGFGGWRDWREVFTKKNDICVKT